MHDLSFDLYLVTDFFMRGFMQIEHGFIACDPMWHGEEWENPEASRKPRINIDANECLAGLRISRKYRGNDVLEFLLEFLYNEPFEDFTVSSWKGFKWERVRFVL